MKASPIRDLFYVVNKTYKNYDTHGKKVQAVWAERMHENFRKGNYDIVYEYVACQELLLFKTIRKDDPFRIKVWRMFAVDFRRAFSDYEFEMFERLKGYKTI